jgi:hypothetical protein
MQNVLFLCFHFFIYICHMFMIFQLLAIQVVLILAVLLVNLVYYRLRGKDINEPGRLMPFLLFGASILALISFAAFVFIWYRFVCFTVELYPTFFEYDWPMSY